MTLYCQSCGTQLVEVERDDDQQEWHCLGCGDLYRRPDGYGDDQLVAWLGFPPVPLDAA